MVSNHFLFPYEMRSESTDKTKSWESIKLVSNVYKSYNENEHIFSYQKYKNFCLHHGWKSAYLLKNISSEKKFVRIQNVYEKM